MALPIVRCVNGIVVFRICWLAMLVRKFMTWLSIPMISLGPALLKLLTRLVMPPLTTCRPTPTVAVRLTVRLPLGVTLTNWPMGWLVRSERKRCPLELGSRRMTGTDPLKLTVDAPEQGAGSPDEQNLACSRLTLTLTPLRSALTARLAVRRLGTPAASGTRNTVVEVGALTVAALMPRFTSPPTFAVTWKVTGSTCMPSELARSPRLRVTGLLVTPAAGR